MPTRGGPARLRDEMIRPTGPWVGVEVRDTVGSTNAEASRRREPWLAIAAETQSEGRGRLDRSWTTTPGQSLAVSALVPAPPQAAWVPLVTGLAVRRAVEDSCGLAVVLKWPNDVLCPADGDRKLAGILCEWVPGPPAGVVVGCGVNVSQGRADLPVDTATSLALCGAGAVSREALLTAYLSRLADLVTGLSGAGADRVRDEYRAACSTLGRDVVLHLPDGTTRAGTATAIDDDGRLVLQTPTGRWAAPAGDVVHVRPAGKPGGERGEESR